jgi:excisionase family DNA binding protein
MNTEFISPAGAAIKLGVATITVYKWIEQGKLASTRIKAGSRERILIETRQVDLLLAANQARNHRDVLPPPEDRARAWIEKYRTLIGFSPPLCAAYRLGKVSFEDMQQEARRIFSLLSE